MKRVNLPPDETFRIPRQGEFLGEVKTFPPVHNLTVGVGGIFRAEWGPTHKALEHDRTNRPPIAQVGVPLAVEDLGSNVVGGTDSRVRHGATRLSPGVDLSTVGHRQVDRIVEVAGVAILVLGR